MGAPPTKGISFQEYVALDDASELRHEYVDGGPFAMAGGTPEHAALVSSVHLAIGTQIGEPCRAFVESLRVRTPSGKAAYPDVVIVCGSLTRDPEDANTITNPNVIVEVLPESTEAYDRGAKFAHYRSCPSLTEYVLVASQGRPRIERFVKRDGVWIIGDDAVAGEVQRLQSVGVVLDVDAIYRGLLGDDGRVRTL
ncbi:MAG: Uma2 family endonuclease [Deltaproteobacteria bacterium]|nr:Uma2 family endonuclease [Deltaproteobacteria bacterium]